MLCLGPNKSLSSPRLDFTAQGMVSVIVGRRVGVRRIQISPLADPRRDLALTKSVFWACAKKPNFLAATKLCRQQLSRLPLLFFYGPC